MRKLILLMITMTAMGFMPIQNGANPVDIVATFQGGSNKALYFKVKEGEKLIEFNIVNLEVLSTYDFKDRMYIGKTFRLGYEIQYLDAGVKQSGENMEVKEVIERKILMHAELIDKPTIEE